MAQRTVVTFVSDLSGKPIGSKSATLQFALRERPRRSTSAPRSRRPFAQVHRMLTNRYYVGQVTWKGVEYPGTHEPLVDEALFAAVQDRLGANRAAGNRERKHLNYLSGSVFCARCRSRLLYMVTTGKNGRGYECYACSGRHTRSNDCEAPFIPLERVEAAVNALWDSEQAPWQSKPSPAFARASYAT